MVRGNAIGAVGVIAFYLAMAGLLEHTGVAITMLVAMATAVGLTIALAALLKGRA